jgi:hypothetical protein
MILSFSTQLNDKPTYFVEKIWQGFPEADKYIEEWFTLGKIYEKYDFHPDAFGMFPKLHTIREDKTERWKPGMMIDFFINARKKNMFRFAPRIPVISVQEIFMTRRGSMLEITIAKEDSYIGGEDFYVDAFTQGQLATNDGFSEYDDFRNYFLSVIEMNGKAMGNYWFSGKIIHWTNLKY